MHDADDDGLSIRDAKVDIVAPVNSEAKPGTDIVTRHTGMSGCSQPFEVSVKCEDEPVGSRQTVQCNVGMNIRNVTLGRGSDVQGFWRDRCSPTRFTLSRN